MRKGRGKKRGETGKEEVKCSDDTGPGKTGEGERRGGKEEGGEGMREEEKGEVYV